MKARNVETIPEVRRTSYPEPFASRVGDRGKRKLGDAFGLTQYGVNLTTLGPGSESALRHWHTHEDELIYVVSGEVTLITDDGEQVMRAGDVVGFPGGNTDAHHLVNRSSEPVRYLEVGTRIPADHGHYPDDDLAWKKQDGALIPYYKDGRPYLKT